MKRLALGRFSLGSLFALVTILAVALAILVRPALKQRTLNRRIADLTQDHNSVLMTDIYQDGVRYHYWRHVERLFGSEYASTSWHVAVGNPDLTDEEVTFLAQFPGIRSVAVDHAKVTDDFVAALCQVPGLEVVSLNNTNVTDASLDALDKYADLHELFVCNTYVTKDRMLRFRAEHSNLVRSHWSERASDEQCEAIRDCVRAGFDVSLYEGFVEFQLWQDGLAQPVDVMPLAKLTGEHKIELTLSDSSINSEQAALIRELKNVVRMSIIRSQYKNLEWLENFACLKNLMISFPKSESPLRGLRHCDSLERLTIRIDSKHLPVGLFELPQSASLKSLEIWAPFSEASGKSIATALSSFRELERLRLARGPRFAAADWQRFAELKQLRFLGLHDSNISNDDLTVLARLPSLRDLDLTGPTIDDGAVPHLMKLTRLSSLDVSETQITNRGLEDLAKIESLISLCFDGIANPGPNALEFTQNGQ